MLFVGVRRFSVHVFHALHHWALRHGIRTHLHVLHHVSHHLVLHFFHASIHRDPLLHHAGDNSRQQSRFLVFRRTVHLGDLCGEVGVLRLHVGHHVLFLFLHLLAAFHHFTFHHHFPFHWLRRFRFAWRPDWQRQGQGEAGTE